MFATQLPHLPKKKVFTSSPLNTPRRIDLKIEFVRTFISSLIFNAQPKPNTPTIAICKIDDRRKRNERGSRLRRI